MPNLLVGEHNQIIYATVTQIERPSSPMATSRYTVQKFAFMRVNEKVRSTVI